MYFSTVAPTFSAASVCYQSVPEPATIGLLSLGVLSLIRRKKLS